MAFAARQGQKGRRAQEKKGSGEAKSITETNQSEVESKRTPGKQKGDYILANPTVWATIPRKTFDALDVWGDKPKPRANLVLPPVSSRLQ